MKIIRAISAVMIAAWLVGLAGAAQAQNPYRPTEKEMKRLMDRIEKGADRFRSSLDRVLDRSRLDGTKAEDNINQFMKDFEAATDRLEDNFEDDRSAASDVEEVLRRAAIIDNFMSRHRLSTQVENNWANLRRNLDELASAYNVSWNWLGISNQPFRINDEQVKKVLDRVEEGADRFRASLDDSLDKSRFDDTRAEDEINSYVKEFEQATDQLKDRYNDSNSAAGLVEEVLRRAARIDVFIDKHRLTTRAQGDWASLRRNLDDLAMAYNVTWRWQ